STNMSSSSNEPLSMRSSMRSRAVSLPRLCCASMRAAPPPARAPARRCSSLSRMSFMGKPLRSHRQRGVGCPRSKNGAEARLSPAASPNEDLAQRLGLALVQPGDVVDAPDLVDLDEIERNRHRLSHVDEFDRGLRLPGRRVADRDVEGGDLPILGIEEGVEV